MRILKATLVVLVSALAFGGKSPASGQEKSPVSGYISCQSLALPNQDTLYFSSAYEGSIGDDDNAFTQYLKMKYGFTGQASCNVAFKAYTTIPKLQESYNAVVAQWRSQGKRVVETGWTNHGAPALTGNTPNGPVTPVTVKPKAAVPDPDDQPATAAQPPVSGPVEKYTYCVTMGSPRDNGSSRASYYYTGIFGASPTLHPQHDFQTMLQAAHPQENIAGVSCMTAQPMDTTQTAMANDQRGKRANYNVVATNWKPKT